MPPAAVINAGFTGLSVTAFLKIGQVCSMPLGLKQVQAVCREWHMAQTICIATRLADDVCMTEVADWQQVRDLALANYVQLISAGLTTLSETAFWKQGPAECLAI